MQELMLRPARLLMPGIGRLTAALRRFTARSRTPLSDAARVRADLAWGLAGIVCVVVLAAGFGLLYVTDFDVRTPTAYLTDAGSVRVGDPVRLAGVTVGEVKSLTAQDDRVEMRFTVAKDVFLGAQTTLAVRMLTIVGGHYVVVVPAGTEPLGTKPIPADRVVLPYSLPQVFQEAIRPVSQIDGSVLRQNVAALETAITKNPQAIGTTLTAIDNIVDIMNRQNADISRSLKLADEYATALDGSKQVLRYWTRCAPSAHNCSRWCRRRGCPSTNPPPPSPAQASASRYRDECADAATALRVARIPLPHNDSGTRRSGTTRLPHREADAGHALLLRTHARQYRALRKQ